MKYTCMHDSQCLHRIINCVCIIYINKEELKMVVRDILACAQPNRHEIFTAHWSPYRRVSSRGRRAQIRFGRGARGEKPENDRPPFWFYGESIRTSVFTNTSQHNTSVHGLHDNGGNAEAADGAVVYDLCKCMMPTCCGSTSNEI